MVGGPVMTWPIALLIAVLAAAWLLFFVADLQAEVQASEPELAVRHLHIVQSDVPSTVRAVKDTGPYDWAVDIEADGGAA